MNKKAASVSIQYFSNLKPNLEATDAEIKAFQAHVAKLDGQASMMTDGEERLKKWLNDTIADLQSKKIARDLSAKWSSDQ